ncbi:MAG: V-type ATP synthase subunit I [Provencibacterium sp.]|jgi:V/A-type H+-transporting ATPase subunit I|nr:V-type ATP synthase subunit I [Provencibacterium sp.]
MILKMEKLMLYALSEDKQSIMDRLMGLGCVQMVPPEELDGFEELGALAGRDAPAIYEYEGKLSEISSALGVLREYEPKAKLFAKKDSVSLDSMLALDSTEEALKIAASVKGIISNIAEVRSFQSADQFTRQMLLPWQRFDLALEHLSTRFCSAALYTLPLTANLDELRQELDNLRAPLEEVSADADQRYIAVISLQADREAAASLIKERGGLPVTLPELTGTAAENIARLEQKNGQYEKNIQVLTDSLQQQAQSTKLLKLAFDQLSTAIGAQRAKQNLLLTERSFAVCGWVAEVDKERVEKALEPFTCCYEFQKPAAEENPPVRFKNNALVEPFEVITEMYGLPNPQTLDPDPLIAPFFFLFFGMMLSDAGYGLVLAIAGFFAAKMSRKGTFGNKMFRLISLCGISTVIWGALYGSWFGDIITVFSKTFFGLDVTVPKLIDPLQQPMTIMIISFIFGAVHLFVGMGVKAYLCLRQGDWQGAIFDIGLWYLVLIGLPLMLLGGTAFEIGKWMAIIGAIGLVLTQGRQKPNIIGKITGGVMSLYDITGYFSDVLSYSRILALGLATGVIASVVNILSTLPGANIIGAVLFLVIFLFGHFLNLAINALGSYVHTSRLQYVEFFGKFYEGGGRPFTPFKPETKYNLIESKEEN